MPRSIDLVEPDRMSFSFNFEASASFWTFPFGTVRYRDTVRKLPRKKGTGKSITSHPT